LFLTIADAWSAVHEQLSRNVVCLYALLTDDCSQGWYHSAGKSQNGKKKEKGVKEGYVSYNALIGQHVAVVECVF